MEAAQRLNQEQVQLPAPDPSYVEEAKRTAFEAMRRRGDIALQNAEKWKRAAEECFRTADLIRLAIPQAHSSPDGQAKISDWSRVDRATAMSEFLRQYPVSKKIKIADVVAALTKGGCDVAGKFRPGSTDYQREGERNLFIAASRNGDIYGYDKKAREIWRK
jgi:hypothetical protein